MIISQIEQSKCSQLFSMWKKAVLCVFCNIKCLYCQCWSFWIHSYWLKVIRSLKQKNSYRPQPFEWYIYKHNIDWLKYSKFYLALFYFASWLELLERVFSMNLQQVQLSGFCFDLFAFLDLFLSSWRADTTSSKPILWLWGSLFTRVQAKSEGCV